MIIGHRLERRAPERREAVDGEVALRARAITGGIVRGVDLDVHRGEVLGITGLLGSGFEELVHLLFGAREQHRV